MVDISIEKYKDIKRQYIMQKIREAKECVVELKKIINELEGMVK